MNPPTQAPAAKTGPATPNVPPQYRMVSLVMMNFTLIFGAVFAKILKKSINDEKNAPKMLILLI